MTILIGVLAGASALCEIFGTYTVWKSYRLSSGAALAIVEAIEALQDAEDKRLSDPGENLRFQMKITVDPGALKRERTFTRAAIASVASPLMPQRWTSLGLAAYVVGAILGFAAVLVAL